MQKNKDDLVSVIITTRNETKNINTCLKSIKDQSYKNIEIIVVDNHSDDTTKIIARKFTKNVFNIGPERSAQRNYGASKARGKYLLFIDADMKLSKEVVKSCLEVVQTKQVGGVIIPEESYGKGYWAQVKKLERSFYVGSDLIEAARFYPKNIFNKMGGFDESITGPEDWDFSQRVRNSYGLERIVNYIYHNEGELKFWRSVNKKYYYAKKFAVYKKKDVNREVFAKQSNIFNRYAIFLSNPRKLFSNPLLGLGVLIIKTSEYLAGGFGYLFSLKSNLK